MKTLLFAPCFLDGKDPGGSPRLARVQRWIDYYMPLREDLGFHDIWLCDDASDFSKVLTLGGGIFNEEFEVMEPGNPKLNILRYSPRLHGGVGSIDNHAYCWKALYVMRSIMEKYGYEKAITIDTDTFVLTERLSNFIRDEVNEGWTAFWIPKYGFPSAELHVLNPSGMHQFNEFTTPHYMAHQGKRMETAIPFTRVIKDFKGDRYGDDAAYQMPDMDYYGNASLSTLMEYQKHAPRTDKADRENDQPSDDGKSLPNCH